jgi:hypothetical protein
MKGGDYIQKNNNDADSDNRGYEYGTVAPGQPAVQRNTQQLLNLGFEEDELEMFFDTYNLDNNEIIEKYLEIASSAPYNLNWHTVEDVEHADYDTNISKPNGTTYTKHDIANDVLSYFSDNMQGGKKRKNKRNKSKKHNINNKNKSKKRKINKSKQSRKRKGNRK